MFWTLHAGHMSLPGAACSRLSFAAYRIDATLIDAHHVRCRSQQPPASDPNENVADSLPAASRVDTSADASAPCDTDEHFHEPDAQSSSLPGRDHTVMREACIDLRIASCARALVATRTARLSDKHTRSLRTKGKHIGFV
eukprot:4274682-Pleurochrysis_carterae.AAC.1